MIKLKDIIESVTSIIVANNGVVLSDEVDEGFDRPAYFVNLFPVSIAKDGLWEENVTATVTIDYVPKIETIEECVRVSDILCDVFSGKLAVCDRKLDIGDVAIISESNILTFSFELDFWRETNNNLPEFENMENLKIREDVE